MAGRVFLCHSSGDKTKIRDLYRRLQQDGLRPWLDEEDILPGEDWKSQIRRAITESRCVLVCLSKSSATKRGYVQKEIRHALDVADEQPDGTVFLIPVRLEPCDVPDRLGTRQWVDLFAAGGYERLLRSLGREQPAGAPGAPDGGERAAAPGAPPASPPARRSLRGLLGAGRIPGHPWWRSAAVLLLLAAVVVAVRFVVAGTGDRSPGPAALVPHASAPTAQSLGEPLDAHSKAAARSLAFTPGDGVILASGGYDFVVRLWDVADPTEPRSLGQPLRDFPGPVYSVAFAPDDGTILATGSKDQPVRLWDVADPSLPMPVAELEGHTGLVLSVAFAPGGRILATGGADRTVRLWDVADPTGPRALGQPLVGHSADVRSVAFSPDGKILATGGADRTVRLWDVADPSRPMPLAELEGHTGEVTSVAFAPKGATLATTGGEDQTVRLWDVADPSRPMSLAELEGHTGMVWAVAYAPDGRTLASGGDETVRLWDVADPTRARPLGRPLEGHSVEVRSVAFAPGGKILASGDDMGTVRLWPVD